MTKLGLCFVLFFFLWVKEKKKVSDFNVLKSAIPQLAKTSSFPNLGLGSKNPQNSLPINSNWLTNWQKIRSNNTDVFICIPGHKGNFKLILFWFGENLNTTFIKFIVPHPVTIKIPWWAFDSLLVQKLKNFGKSCGKLSHWQYLNKYILRLAYFPAHWLEIGSEIKALLEWF